MHVFITGVILGFSIAVPVGPIGILCIRRSIQYGRWSGFFSGLGAAVADTLYGSIAAFGLTAISKVVLANEIGLHLIGGAFLIYLGGKIFFTKVIAIADQPPHKSLLSDFISTFFLTLTNPLTILSYLAIFTSLGLAIDLHAYSNSIWLIIGVFCGSVLWWLILSEGVTLFRKRVSPKIMLWINRIAGLLIISYGLLAWTNIGY